MNLLPGETMPTEADLAFYDGLSEIRYRADGAFAVVLCIREQDMQPVIALSPEWSMTPFTFEVDPGDANSAFEHPYTYAPELGKKMMQRALNGSSTDETEAEAT